MLLLALHIGVEEAHIALTSTPEHVAVTAELDGGVDGVLDLQHCACSHVEIRVGGCTVHIALVAEYIGCTPEKLDAGLGLLLLCVSNDLLEVCLVLLRARGLVNEVGVVEAVVLDAELLHDLEACIHLVLCPFDCSCTLVPREGLGAAAELVCALSAEGVPPGHGELEPVLHLLAGNYLLRIVITECKRVL